MSERTTPAPSAATEVPVGGPLARPWRWLSLGMFALIFLAAFEVLAVTTVMPLVVADLDGEHLYALAFSVPLAAGVVGMVVAGNWSDRSGPLPPLIAAGVLFVIGLVIAGLAPSMPVLVLGRLVHGIGGAAVIVPLYVIVARVYPESVRSRVFAGFAAAWVIPSIVGPAVAGFVAEQLDWRWVFLGVIALVLPAGAMMLVPLLRVHDQVRGDPSVPWSGSRLAWSVLAAFAALGVSLAKELPEPWRWIVAVVGIFVAIVAVRPLLPPGALRAARGMPATVLMRAIVAGAFFASEIYLPYLLIERYGLMPSLAGAVLTGAGISWAVASWLQGRLGDRISNADVVRIGAGLLAVSLVVVLGVAAFTLHPAVAFVAWTACGAAMGFMYPRFSVSVLEQSTQESQGFNSAALTIGESLGAAVALAITALVASVVGPDAFTAEFLVTVAIAIVGVALSSRVHPPR
ncbi:MFS family permease [Agromyces flavus]|uniref:MFS family permease n=1 Tax=Agromyces flavus TaxID=589382 RepID=A0A1H1X0D5_9MICO|nr:MFS transporter [Agromyces flavus]MCP2366295.1 MFS family permease [Agromyces flavus]GGI44388.1 MFS transporter [Agromyces flavus]SDT02520.1 Predicted arabinose efflux permease, MFS family [Agromyces flavus]